VKFGTQERRTAHARGAENVPVAWEDIVSLFVLTNLLLAYYWFNQYVPKIFEY